MENSTGSAGDATRQEVSEGRRTLTFSVALDERDALREEVVALREQITYWMSEAMAAGQNARSIEPNSTDC